MQKITVSEFELIDSICQSRDINKLYKLNDHSAFSIALYQILVSVYDENPNQLNICQLNLFLSMHLENSGQSCGILSCLQEWLPEHLDKFVNALREIDAPKSAGAIEKAIQLLPKDGSNFLILSFNNTKNNHNPIAVVHFRSDRENLDSTLPISGRTDNLSNMK